MAKALDEKIAVMQAALAGKEIEYIYAGEMSNVFEPRKWAQINRIAGCCWNWERYDYRVKPEPRRWTLRVRDDGTVYGWIPTLVPLSDEEVVEVVEVLK